MLSHVQKSSKLLLKSFCFCKTSIAIINVIRQHTWSYFFYDKGVLMGCRNEVQKQACSLLASTT